METIPKETTPFHIDRGMATKFTSSIRGWLLFVGGAPPYILQRLAGDVPTLHRKYRASEARQCETDQEGEVAGVDAGRERHAEQPEGGDVLEPARQLVDGADL